jgi:hypothetical protein
MKKMQGIGFPRDDARRNSMTYTGREEPEPVPLTASSSFCFLMIFLPTLWSFFVFSFYYHIGASEE